MQIPSRRKGVGSSFRAVRCVAAFLSVALMSGALLVGCRCDDEAAPDEAERDKVTGLTPAESNEVLAQVGQRTITLGDFVATLLRMDRFERLRYQSEERQKQLLDEMIEVELLAQEARRRGIDKKPQVQLSIQQALRDELLQKLEANLPPLEEISERDVRAYYDAHRDEFREPERRRVLLIRVGSEQTAKKVLEEARGASGSKWGELAREYSQDRTNLGQTLELAGDSGFVSAPGAARGENPAIPEGVREAIFKVEKLGDVIGEVVTDGGSFYVARLAGISPARDRSVADADRAIRVELRRQMFVEAEKEFEQELRRKYPVVIDEAAVAAIATQTVSAQPVPAQPVPAQPAPAQPAPSEGQSPPSVKPSP